MEPKNNVLEEIEWKLKEIWSEYQKTVQEKEAEKAKKLLAEYNRLCGVYKVQKMIINEL